MEADYSRELLFADAALAAGVGARDVAVALEAFRGTDDDRRAVGEALEASGAIDGDLREEIAEHVERLIADADGDAEVALARRGGLDRSIHASLGPETSAALKGAGARVRAPLRVIDQERYQEFSLVSRGGMGVVYLALDTELNRRVAFKMVRPDPSAPKDAPAPETPLQVTPPDGRHPEEERTSFEQLKIRFLQEAWVTGAMEHPGVVPVYELGKTESGIPYYTMRYVTGERTLATAIRELADIEDRLGLLEPFLKVCDTIRYAHARGVIHRDLKPENVALGEFGEAVVLDWGLSKMADGPDVSGSTWRARIEELRDATDLKTVAGALGTPGYMAPEAALGQSEEVDKASDIYSLGVILFEILTGRLPFRFKTYLEYVQQAMEQTPPPAHEVVAGVPPELAEVAARALARDKRDRFDSVDEMAQALRWWLTEGRLEQQVTELVELARSELRAARERSGNMALWHLDRATAACTRALHLRADHHGALALKSELKRQREEGIRHRVHAGRRRLMAGAAILVLVVGPIVALAIARRRAGSRARIQTERDKVASVLGDLEEERQRRRAVEEQLAAQRRHSADTLRTSADLYASMSARLLGLHHVGAARLVAAKALTVAPSLAAWRALAAADARRTPTLHHQVTGLGAGPVALGPKGRMLFARSPNGIWMIDLLTRRRIRSFAAGKVRLLALSPDSNRLATFDDQKARAIWDTRTGKLTAKLLEQGERDGTTTMYGFGGSRVTAAAFSPDGEYLFAGLASYLIRWRAADGLIDADHNAELSATALRVGRNGRHLYVGDAGGDLGRYPVSLSSPSWVHEDELAARVIHLAESDDGNTIAACTADHRVYTFDEKSLEPFYRGPFAESRFAYLGSGFQRLYAVDPSGTLAVSRTDEPQPVALVQGPPGQRPFGFSVSRNRAMLAVSFDGFAQVWDLRGRGQVGTAEPVTATAQASDGRRVWLARRDRTIELWDSTNRRRLARWPTGPAAVTALATDGELLFSASLDNELRVWTSTGDKLLASFLGPEFPTALAFGEGALIVGTLDGAVEAWSWKHKRRISRLREPGGLPILAVEVSEDRIFAWDDPAFCRQWNLQTRDALAGAPSRPPSPPAADRLPPILGEAVDWIRKDPVRRLIEIENQLGLMLDGAEVKRVPPARYLPGQPRSEPWSR